MLPEHDETWHERLGDACVGIAAILIVLALLAPGWL